MNNFILLTEIFKPNFRKFIKDILIQYNIDLENENENITDENTLNHIKLHIVKEYQNKDLYDMLLEFTYIFNIGIYIIPFEEIEKVFKIYYENWDLEPLKKCLNEWEYPLIKIKDCVVIEAEKIHQDKKVLDLFCEVVEHYLF